MIKDKKYVHLVSYMTSNNITGVITILSDWAKIDTVTKMKNTIEIIEKRGSIKPIITNIVTMKNR